MTVQEAKQHLVIDDSFHDDDAYIASLIAVSEVAVANRCKYDSIDELKVGGVLPPPLAHAVKFMVAHLYNNREPISFTQSYDIPKTFEYLLMPYVRYAVR